MASAAQKLCPITSLAVRSPRAMTSAALRPRVSYLTGLALVVGLFAYLSAPEVVPSGDWVPTILLATTVLLTGSVYWLKIREFLLLGQVPAVLGLLLSLGFAFSASAFTWPLFCASALMLSQAHWWRWQRDQFSGCCPSWARSTHRSNVPLANRLTVIIEIIFSVGFVLQLLVWLGVVGVEFDQKWLWLGALLTVGMTLYSVLTRARFIGLFSQVYLLVSCWVMFKICIEPNPKQYATLTLIPIATMYLMNLGIPIAIARIGQVPKIIHAMVDRVQLAYRIIAAALGLLWIHSFVPDDLQVLVFILIGVAFFAVQCLRSGREWEWAALVYALVGYCTLIIEFTGKIASWESLLAIAVLFVGQQLARRRGNEVKVPDGVHKWLILVGGTLLFTWLSIKVSVPGDHSLHTIAWTVLGVCYFGTGLGLKERWYRLMGLGTLAIALVSLVPIIWQMEPEMKIASFFVMGLVFIGLGFVYTRFKDKIKKLL